MYRGEDNIAQRVVALQRALQDLKTSQFTSQNSGMSFKLAATLVGSIPFVANADQVTIVTNYFTPESGRPAICVPHFEIDPDGFVVEEYHDYSVGYTNYAIYAADGTTFLGSLDVWPFYHLRDTDSGVYGWQTVAFTRASANFSIPFSLGLRATDSGDHTLTVETSTL